LFGSVSVVFAYIFFISSLSSLSLWAVGIIFYLVFSWIIETRTKRQNDITGDSENDASSSRFIEFVVLIGADSQEILESLLAYRKFNSTKFTFHFGVILAIGAYLGSLFSGATLVVLSVYCVLLVPGMIKYEVANKIYKFWEPYQAKVIKILRSSKSKSPPNLTNESKPKEN